MASRRPPPLFTIDLGNNGGMFAPRLTKEMVEWAEKESVFWTWFPGQPGGSVRGAINFATQHLPSALNTARAADVNSADPSALANFIREFISYLTATYLTGTLPHSSTPLAKRIEALRLVDPIEAQSYLYVHLPTEGYPFDARDVSSMRGMIRAISERDGVSMSGPAVQAAVLESLDDLRVQYDAGLGQRSLAIDLVHEEFDEVAVAIRTAAGEQSETFSKFSEDSGRQFSEALNDHKETMNALQATFRTKMGLRAPAEYWSSRQGEHNTQARRLGIAVGVLMFLLALAVCGAAYWVGKGVTSSNQPAYWKLSMAVLLAVVGVWAVRLVVKMYLSHVHLATDAAERVTMVKTYLSLMESGAVIEEADREIILQALFRKGTDGLVKDESLPHPLLEVLTRTKN